MTFAALSAFVDVPTRHGAGLELCMRVSRFSRELRTVTLGPGARCAGAPGPFRVMSSRDWRGVEGHAGPVSGTAYRARQSGAWPNQSPVTCSHKAGIKSGRQSLEPVTEGMKWS